MIRWAFSSQWRRGALGLFVAVVLLLPNLIVGQTGDGSSNGVGENWKQQVLAARDTQEIAVLSRMATAEADTNESAGGPSRLYRRAYASSALAEVYLELGQQG
jgi:hypothetical protein